MLVTIYTLGKSPPSLVGKFVDPIKYKSTSLAALRPSEIAQTIDELNFSKLYLGLREESLNT